MAQSLAMVSLNIVLNRLHSALGQVHIDKGRFGAAMA